MSASTGRWTAPATTLRLLCWPMLYLVLLRFGLRDPLRPVLTVERLADSISCREKLPPHPGATWRLSPADLIGPQVIYSVPGPRLVHPSVPAYDWAVDPGATVQI